MTKHLTHGRAAARKTLLLWSAPVVALTLTVGLWLVLTWGANARGIDQSDAGRHGSAEELFAQVADYDAMDEDIPAFNRGTQQFAQERYPQARDSFAEALRLAPPERSCATRFNLERSIEMMGDQQAEQDREGAKKEWRHALDVVGAGDCPSFAAHDAGDRLAKAQARLEEKLKDPQDTESSSTSSEDTSTSSSSTDESSSTSTSSDDPGSSTSGASPTTLSEEQREKLASRSSEAAQENREAQDQETPTSSDNGLVTGDGGGDEPGGEGGTEPPPPEKPW